jgi:hypothetical protein
VNDELQSSSGVDFAGRDHALFCPRLPVDAVVSFCGNPDPLQGPDLEAVAYCEWVR